MIGCLVWIVAFVLAWKGGEHAIAGRWEQAGPYAIACVVALLIAAIASKVEN